MHESESLVSSVVCKSSPYMAHRQLKAATSIHVARLKGREKAFSSPSLVNHDYDHQTHTYCCETAGHELVYMLHAIATNSNLHDQQ